MRQRVVGSLVLGCLAIILIPVLLDGEGVVAPPLASSFPPTPVFGSDPVPPPLRPTVVDSAAPLRASPPVGASVAPAPAPAASTAGSLRSPDPAATEGTGLAAAADTIAVPAVGPLGAPLAREDIDALESAVAAVMARDQDAAPTSDNTPQREANGLPRSYVVRLGSFGDTANADALLQKLLAANHKAYSRQVQTANGALQVVYVGPVLTSGEAGSLLATLAQDFQLQGVVETFTPPALQ